MGCVFVRGAQWRKPKGRSALTCEVWWLRCRGNSGPATGEICVPARDSPAWGWGGVEGRGLGERHLSASRAFLLRPPPGGLRSPAGGSVPHHAAGPHPAQASLSPVGLHARAQLWAQLLTGADSFECGPQVSNPGVGLGVSEEGRLHSVPPTALKDGEQPLTEMCRRQGAL